jgi:adenosylcobinamide-GDP ribazoletransferase
LRFPEGFFAAVQFLTRVPVPAGDYKLETAVVWLPLVGLLLGAILAATDFALGWLRVPTLLNASALVVLLLVLSGGLHADGLMDTADAVFGHATPERRLEIMHDPRAGAFGVIALVAVVALKISALDGLSGAWRTALVWLAPGLGRWAIVLLAAVFPYGRPGGLGAPLKLAATPLNLALASVVPAAACLVAGPVGVAAAAVAAVAALGIGRWLMRLLPGLTGDCYGAVCEVVETVVWVGGAVAMPLFG